jgi:Tol biopolymer transport system component
MPALIAIMLVALASAWQAHASTGPTVISTRQLTSGADSYHPRWSPDGQTIAFTSLQTGEPQLSIIPAAGGTATLIDTGLSGDMAIGWRPDGDHISFDAYRPDTGRLAIWTVSLTTGEVTRESMGTAPAAQPCWRSDGARLAFLYGLDGGNIWSQAPGGADLQRHTSDPAIDYEPQWSPDGTRLLFTSERTGSSDVWMIDLASNQLTRVTDHPAYDGRAVWSPDGRWIAFTSDRTGRDHVWVVPAQGGTPTSLTTSSEAGGTMADWSPDGRHIAFVASSQIWIMTLDTGLQPRPRSPSRRVHP